MIPYDDLVTALSAWRARQGLPVNTLGGSGSGPTPTPGSGPHSSPGSGPYASPGSGPYASPGSGPFRAAPPAPPMGASEEVVAADMLDEEVYEAEGNDFAMGFAPADNAASEVEPTAIGEVPERPTQMDIDDDRQDW